MDQAELTIVHTESSMAWGGQEIRILTELRNLRALGWNTALWAPAASDIFRRAFAEGIPVLDIPFRGIADTASLRAVRSHAVDVDLIVTHSSIDSWVVGLATRFMSKRPALVRMRHLSTPIRNHIPYRWFPDGIGTTSEAIREQIIAGGVKCKEIICLPTGVDLERFQPAPSARVACRRALRLPAAGFIVGGVFVIRSWKGIYDFVKVCAAVPEAHFVVAGEGPSREAMEASAVEMGVSKRMTFLGHIERVEDVFHAMDVFLFPSVANEGIAQALLQAQACGVPAIVSGLASNRETAAHAIFCPPGAVDEFASAVRKMRSDESLSRQTAQLGLEWVKKFSQKDMMRSMDGFYRRVVSGRS